MRNKIPRRVIGRLLLAAAVAALVACSSVPVHFYTLSPGDRVALATAASVFAIDVLPVAIPAQVSIPQFVVRDSAQTVVVLEHERWSAPLQDEIRSALSQHVSSALGAVDASRISNARLPTYRVRVDIQRFDAWLGQSVSVDALWTLTAPDKSDVALLCSVQIAQGAPAGYSGLVEAYQQVLTRLADQIAAVVRANELKQALVCQSGASPR